MSLGRRSTPRRKVHPMRVAQPLAPVTPTLGYAEFSELVAKRAGGRCQGGFHPLCPSLGGEVHHRWMRSQGGLDTFENCRWLCLYCHDWIHRGDVRWARRHLWLISAGHPLLEPVMCGRDCTDDHRPGLEATA